MLVTVGPTDSDRLRQPRDATKDFSKACKFNRFRPAALNNVKSGYPPLAPVPGGTTTPSSTTTYIRPCVRSYLPRASRDNVSGAGIHLSIIQGLTIYKSWQILLRNVHA